MLCTPPCSGILVELRRGAAGAVHPRRRSTEMAPRLSVKKCLIILALAAAAAIAGFLSVAAGAARRRSSSSSPARRLSTGLAAERARMAMARASPTVERELDAARAAIRRAAAAARRRGHGDLAGGEGKSSNVSSAKWLSFFGDADHARLERVYRNPAAFYRSYVEMERRFKVYVYEEGEPPIAHEGPCKNIYAVEGRFIEELELMAPPPPPPWRAGGGGGGDGVRTWDPARAHAFFLPLSVSQMVQLAYRPLSYDLSPLRAIVADYVAVVASRHRFWNRSAGADHFMLSCHDWGPHASRGHPELYANAIRALCNANTSEGFRPDKDVSIPEINLYDGDMPPELMSPAPPPPLSSRPFLAFFAGGRHGHVRNLLLRHWKGRDPAVFPVYEYDLPSIPVSVSGDGDTDAGGEGGNPYYWYMRRSRFCLCPSGHEVASPRVVEAIHAGCVPVVVADGYAPPFADVLRWEAFSVAVAVADVPRLRELLERIPAPEVERLRDGVRLVKRHFMLHQPPERLDMFHMILHSVWLRRLNLRLNSH
ncbi:probable glycosyltransferase At5g25310 [Oryza glaberrima]|uniref:probable glycosyltransferase At5g25310 n=1 Tax=Oryza glaberrima TaxID=4538 RepID=UPI00224C5F5A|nr:probable glycosyltransferase At5g25310 [Oryza glaberrima]